MTVKDFLTAKCDQMITYTYENKPYNKIDNLKCFYQSQKNVKLSDEILNSEILSISAISEDDEESIFLRLKK